MTNENLLSISDAARRLNRSKQWVRNSMNRNDVTYVLLGKRKYIPESCLEDFFKVVPAKTDNCPDGKDGPEKERHMVHQRI